MRDYTTIQELVNLANEKGGFFEAVLDNYAEDADARGAAVRRMTDSLNVMLELVALTAVLSSSVFVPVPDTRFSQRRRPLGSREFSRAVAAASE
ncbi:MAG: hypothetical protein Q4B19_08435 [Clostridia bacterium]|nr:hypothetical protein [Clostridia bacterium]